MSNNQNRPTERNTPLGHLFESTNDGNTTPKTTAAVCSGEGSKDSSQSERSSKCSNRREIRLGAGYANPNSKPKRGKRFGKSKPSRSNSKRDANHKVPVGHCRCGELVAPYDYNRCEDCFAEDSMRYSGRVKLANLN